jgi:tetratricopeptide (TPR) repeat protein
LLKREAKAAIDVFQKLTELRPENPVALERLGSAYVEAGQPDKAGPLLETALRVDPKNSKALTAIARIQLRQRGPDSALERIHQQIARIPNQPAFYEILGQFYMERKNFAKAEESLRKAVSLDPNRAETYGLLSQLYVSQQAPDKAIKELENALKLSPKSASTHALLGALHESRNAAGKAVIHYREALRLDPGSVVVMNNLAWLLAENGESRDEALYYARLANARMPNNPNILDTTGWIYHKMGAYAPAISLFEQCARKHPKASKCRFHLALSYFESGSVDVAKSAVSEAIKLDASLASQVEAQEILKASSRSTSRATP